MTESLKSIQDIQHVIDQKMGGPVERASLRDLMAHFRTLEAKHAQLRERTKTLYWMAVQHRMNRENCAAETAQRLIDMEVFGIRRHNGGSPAPKMISGVGRRHLDKP